MLHRILLDYIILLCVIHIRKLSDYEMQSEMRKKPDLLGARPSEGLLVMLAVHRRGGPLRLPSVIMSSSWGDDTYIYIHLYMYTHICIYVCV